jgi:hypothetical protein
VVPLPILYCSPNSVRVVESREMRRTGLVTIIIEMKSVYRILIEYPKGKSAWEL